MHNLFRSTECIPYRKELHLLVVISSELQMNKSIIAMMFKQDENRILSYKNILPLMDNAVLFNLIVNSKNKGDDRLNIMVLFELTSYL